jgi:hypothetical protein
MSEQTAQLTFEQAGALAPLVTPEQAASKVDGAAALIDVRSVAGRAASVLTGATVVAKDRKDADGRTS